MTAPPPSSTPPARVLAGVFDPTGSRSVEREAAVRAAIAEEEAVASVEIGPLTLAWSGGPATAGRGLCVLDGELRERDPKRSPEQRLAQAHRALGADMLEKLKGEFAFVVWDPERRRGMLARDPLGVRPLFVHDDGRRLLFGSDIRQVLRLLDRRPTPDRLALARWLAGDERSDEETLYEGVRPLPPGSWIALESGHRAPRRYWTPRWCRAREDRDAVAAVSSRLESAIGRHMGASGNVGVMLSGGLDSAAVAALAAGAARERVRSYSAVFPQHPTVDESKPIGLLGRRLGLRGTQLEVEPGSALAGGLRFLADWAVPPAPPSHFLWQPLVDRAGADGVTRMLDGEGGDELLGVAAYLMADRLRQGRPLATLRLARRVPGSGDRPSRRTVARLAWEYGVVGAVPHRLSRRLGAAEPPAWLGDESARLLREHADPTRWKRLDGPRWWAHLAHSLTAGPAALGAYDYFRRRAATAGVLAHHPLLDLDLVELVLTLPPESSFDPHLDRPLLRAALRGRIPDEVRLRPRKSYFDAFVNDCLTGPDLAPLRLLLGAGARVRAVVDGRALDRLLADPPLGRAQALSAWSRQVWRLATAESWLRLQEDPDYARSALERRHGDDLEHGPTFFRLDDRQTGATLFSTTNQEEPSSR